MAIFNAVPPPEEVPANSANTGSQPQGSHSASASIDIEAWTISALESLSVSPIARGTGTPLSIPLDELARTKQQVRNVTVATNAEITTTPPRRPLSRRDSQKKREALLKGNEGSRQRRRWENDRLVGVPNVQPPLPIDWEVHPTHPVHAVPYHIAQFWDKGVRQRIEDKTAALQSSRKKQQRKIGSATGLGVGEVPRDLRDTAKKSPAVRGWVRVLEEPVRRFLVEKKAEAEDNTDEEGLDSEDEEIVFVGRKAAQPKGQGNGWKKATLEVGSEQVESGMVFDSLGDDESASFKRWLTHSISDYYGLESRSVTTGNPARRVVYVGVNHISKPMGPRLRNELPRPLWEMC